LQAETVLEVRAVSQYTQVNEWRRLVCGYGRRSGTREVNTQEVYRLEVWDVEGDDAEKDGSSSDGGNTEDFVAAHCE
jgi:hypothetical protein